MSLVLLPPLPMEAPILQIGPDGKTSDYLSADWYQTFFAMAQRLNASSQVINNPVTRLVNQEASISPVSLPIGAVPDGVYRLSWYARITRAASTSSSLTVTFQWSDTGVAISGGGAAITGNTTTTVQSGVATVNADSDTPISYSTTYASVGGTTMQYSLVLLAEFMGN